MSILDAIFNKSGGFRGVRCNTLLKLTIPRIKLLRNRRENQLRQMRKDIAKLLENGQEATARIRVEHIIREENMMAAQEILELFCELITVRIPIIEAQRECPLDLKEAISSICFAAPRCADLPELQQVQVMFAGKYGREFVAAATELMPDCSVNRQIIELLSIRAPPVEVKVKLLKEIAEEHGVDWDPSETESEFLKPHEDLLNGPSKFLGGTTVLLLKEKDDETLEHEADFEPGLDLDLPEVPKVTIRPVPAATPDVVNLGVASTTDNVSTFPPSPPSGLLFSQDTDNRPSNLSIQPDPNMESDLVVTEPKHPSTYEPPNVFSDASESRKFIPFVSPPPLSPSPPYKSHEPLSPSPPFKSHESLSPSAPFKSHEMPPSSSESHRYLSQAICEDNVNLEDVLAAAHTAAETAERAAAAARAAASLAQVRISELVLKRNGKTFEKNESRCEIDQSKPRDEDREVIDQHHSFENAVPSPLLESPKLQSESLAHQPSRSTSLEDDPYFSYPNLFGRQDSNLGSPVQASVDNSRFSHDF